MRERTWQWPQPRSYPLRGEVILFRSCIWALLAGAAFVSATGASAYYAPQAPEGEPPIVKTRIDLIDKTVFRQIFDLPARTSPEFSGTIADRNRLLGDRPDALFPRNLAIVCRIEPEGRVRNSSCETDQAGDEGAVLALRAAQGAGALDDFPHFRSLEIKKGREPFFRFIRFELRTPKVDPATINFEQGPIVEMEQIPALEIARKSDRSMREYPPRALREGKDGRGVAECQVQEDLSIACHMLSFEPQENAAVFFGEPRQFFKKIFAGSKLANGNDARGARTRFAISWSLPDDSP